LTEEIVVVDEDDYNGEVTINVPTENEDASQIEN
jgi:hypothetical protein